MNSIHTVLVANRGEIACRVMRTLRRLGIRSIAVYSEADAGAPHVRLADRAIPIGPAPVAESYLCIEKIIEAAKSSAADAIHPGYGFLSENADFSQACEEAGIKFIGPPREAIRIMGNKAESKRKMLAAKVPCIPGYEDTDQSESALKAAGERIGFPLMVKAAAGGGGRGMRLVNSAAELADALSRARSEALNAFGSDELILEKAVTNARHVEIQVFADNHGHCVHLGERDCSVQRRHQKVLEESPCPVMTPALRDAMGTAAVNVARAVDYRGAGTVEFLLDAEQQFYFLEMNTRLQVEHPVTEMVTGLDLVEWQIRVADGEALPLKQEEISLTGHAIEARLYAEDPAQDFLPATGRVEHWHADLSDGIRVDSGIESGSEISPFYDPMVAKIIAYGPTRDIARQRLLQSLYRSALYGPKTNKAFLLQCLENPVFAQGEATTQFIEREGLGAKATNTPKLNALAAVLLHRAQAKQHCANSLLNNDALLNWSSGLPLHTPFQFGAEEAALQVFPQSSQQYRVRSPEFDTVIDIGTDGEPNPHTARVRIDGEALDLRYRCDNNSLWLTAFGCDLEFVNLLASRSSETESASDGHVRAPMHGVVMDVRVAVGDSVSKGQTLLVLEAMKMQHEILSPIDGQVGELRAEDKKQVASGDVLLSLEAAAD